MIDKKYRCYYCRDEVPDCDCGNTEVDDDYGAVCPYCGKMNAACDSDGYLYDEDTCEYDCGWCGKEFSVSVYVSHTWTTTKKCDE